VDLTGRPALVLRYADVGIATYASLRIVGRPERTDTLGCRGDHPAYLRSPSSAGTAGSARRRDPSEALQRALTVGAFTSSTREQTLAHRRAPS
jgi:hypothetical protein